MKKLTTLLCAATLLIAFVACSENGLAPDSRNESMFPQTENVATSTAPVIAQTTEQTSQTFTLIPAPTVRLIDWRNVNLETTLGSQWSLYSPVYFVLAERMWNEIYTEITDITYSEVFLRWSMVNHGFERCEYVKAYENLRESSQYIETHYAIHEIMFGSEFFAIDNHTHEVLVNLELLQHFSVTQDEFARANNTLIEQREILNELSINRGLLRDDEISCPYNWHLTRVEINTLFSGDTTAIMRATLNPWSIMVEDRVYSAQWLIDNSPEQWAAAGIEPDEVTRAFEIFRVVLDDEQEATFESELTEFRVTNATPMPTPTQTWRVEVVNRTVGIDESLTAIWNYSHELLTYILRFRMWDEEYSEQFTLSFEEALAERNSRFQFEHESQPELTGGMLAYAKVAQDAPLAMTEFLNEVFVLGEFACWEQSAVTHFGFTREELNRANAIMDNLFIDEEIDVLLTNDVIAFRQIAKAPLALLTAGGSLYPPEWLLLTSIDEIRRAGVTTEMIDDWLEAYATVAVSFSADYETLFSTVLSAFLGEEVSLGEVRERRNFRE